MGGNARFVKETEIPKGSVSTRSVSMKKKPLHSGTDYFDSVFEHTCRLRKHGSDLSVPSVCPLRYLSRVVVQDMAILFPIRRASLPIHFFIFFI
jgi:hypothetical protein